MLKIGLTFLTAFSIMLPVSLNYSQEKTADEWALNATIIEACSCPMFCQCYFNTKPAAHHEHGMSEHFCKGNLAFKINSGNYGSVNLDGVKFWNAGNLGDDFSDGRVPWMEITFDPSVTQEQRKAIGIIMGYVYPMKVDEFTFGKDAPIDWEYTKDHAIAKLDDGKAGEIILNRYAGMTEEPIVIHNLKYIGAPRNDGFILMPNEIEAYRVGPNAFEFNGTNGFVITIDINSKDIENIKSKM